MKERKGGFGQLAGGIVDNVVQTARRRAASREPRALLYDAAGLSRTVRPGRPGVDTLVANAGKLIDLTTAPPPPVDEAAEEAAAEAETQAEAAAADADEHPGETTA